MGTKGVEVTPEQWEELTRGYISGPQSNVFTGNENDSVLEDLWTATKRGALGVVRSGVGLADLASEGAATEAVGDTLDKWDRSLANEYSQEQQNAAYRRAGEIAAANGEVNKGLAALSSTLSDPRLLMTDLTETLLPSFVPMMGAAKIARAASGVKNLGSVGSAIAGNVSREELAAKLVKPAAYTGEGLIGAGMSANQMASDNIREGRHPGEGLWAAGAVGLTTGGIAAGMGGLSRWAGKEAELAGIMAGRGVSQAMMKGAKPQTLLGGAAKSFVGEGTEEALQGVFEQALPNYAMGRPITEGMGENVAQSALAGGMLGAGMHTVAYPFTPGPDSAPPERRYATTDLVQDTRDQLTPESRAVIDSAAESTPMSGTVTGIPPQGPQGPQGPGGPGTPPPGAAGALQNQTPVQQPAPQQQQPQQVDDDAAIAETMREDDRRRGVPESEQIPAANQDIQAATQQVQADIAAAEQARASKAASKQAKADSKARKEADAQAVQEVSPVFKRATAPHPAGIKDSTRVLSATAAHRYQESQSPHKGLVADAMDRAGEITRTEEGKSRFVNVSAMATQATTFAEQGKTVEESTARLKATADEWIKHPKNKALYTQAPALKATAEILENPHATDAEIKAKVDAWVAENTPKAPEKAPASSGASDFKDKYFLNNAPSRGVRADWTKHEKTIGEEDGKKLVDAIKQVCNDVRDGEKIIKIATAFVKQFEEHKKYAKGNMKNPENGTADRMYHFFNNVKSYDEEQLGKLGVTPERIKQIGQVFQTGKIAEDEYDMAPLFEKGKPNPTVEEVAEVMRNRLRLTGSIYDADDRLYSRLTEEQKRIHDDAEDLVLSEKEKDEGNLLSDEDANAEANARVTARSVNNANKGGEDGESANPDDAFLPNSNETKEEQLEKALTDFTRRTIGRALHTAGVMRKSRDGRSAEPIGSLRVVVRNAQGTILYEKPKKGEARGNAKVAQMTDIFVPPDNAVDLVREQGKTEEVRKQLARSMPELFARACNVVNYAARELSQGSQIDKLYDVLLNTYVAVSEPLRVSGVDPAKSPVMKFFLGLENVLMDPKLDARQKRAEILKQTRPFADRVIPRERNEQGEVKKGHNVQERKQKAIEESHAVAVNQARVFLAKGKATLEDDTAANTPLSERQINELFGTNSVRDEFLSEAPVKDTAEEKTEAEKVEKAIDPADRRIALAKFFNNKTYREPADSEKRAMGKFHKAYVQSEFGESGKRRTVRGEAAIKFADAAARIVTRGTFFPRILRIGEKKKWYKRIQAAVGDFQKTFVGDILGYRERIPSPMDDAGNMNGFVSKVIGNDKLIYDNPYKGIKRAELRPYVAKLEATRQAIQVEFGGVIARDVPKFLTAYAIGLKRFTGPMADLQKGNRLSAMNGYDKLVRNFVDAARCSEKTKQQVLAYMDEAKALAEKEVRRQDQFDRDPTKRVDLPVPDLASTSNEVALKIDEPKTPPKAAVKEAKERNPTNPSKEGATEHAPEYRKTQDTALEEINHPNERVTPDSFKKMMSSQADPEVKKSALYIHDDQREGIALPLDTIVDTLHRSGYSSKALEGVFTQDTSVILSWAIRALDNAGIKVPKGVLFIDGIRSSYAAQGRGSWFRNLPSTKGERIADVANGIATQQQNVACPGGIIRLCRGLPSLMPQELQKEFAEWGASEFAELFARRTGLHELFHAIDAASGNRLGEKFAALRDSAETRQECADMVRDQNGPREIREAAAYASHEKVHALSAGRSQTFARRLYGKELLAEVMPIYLVHNEAKKYINTHYPKVAQRIKETLHALSGGISNSAGGARNEAKNSGTITQEGLDSVTSTSTQLPSDGGHSDGSVSNVERLPGRRVGAGSEGRTSENSEDLHSGTRTSQVPVSEHGTGRGTTVHSSVGETTGRESAGQGRNPSSTGGNTSGPAVSQGVGNKVLPSQRNRGPSGNGARISNPEATATDKILERVPERFKPIARTILGSSKGNGLRLMFTRNFVDTFEKALPSLRTWWYNVERLMQTRAKRQQTAADIVERFKKLSQYEQERVNQVLDESTSLGVWAYRDPRIFPTEESWNKYVARMVKKGPEYGLFMKKVASLSKAAQQSIKEVLDYGTEEKMTLAALAKRNVMRSMQKELDNATGEKKEELQKELDRQIANIDKDLSEALTHPYVPFGRQGSHIVVYRSEKYLRAERALTQYKSQLANQGTPPTEEQKKVLALLEKNLDTAETSPNDYVVEFYESALDANKRYYALKKQFPNAPEEAVQTFDKALYISQSVPKWAQYQSLINQLGKELEGENGTGSVREGDLRRMVAEAQELFTRALPSSSGRKSFLHRKGIAGYNPNMMENFIHHARATSHMIASLETSWDINEALDNVGKEAAARGAFGDRDQATLVANEARRRQKQIFNPLQGGVSGKVMRVTSMWMLLTNPAFYIQNLLQPFMMSAPYINGRFKGDCLPELMRTMKNVAGFVKADRTLRNLRETLSDAEYRALMRARDRQLLTIGINSELGEVGDDTALGRATNFFMRQAQAVETINRVSTFLVAYREGIRHGMKSDEAAAFAERTIEQTHGDYSKENAPSLFNENGLTRTATQFRKFQFIQTGMMFRMMRDAAKGLTPEERAIARRQLAWTLATHLAMAGVKGLPAANLILGAIAFCFGAPGDDDEDLIRRAVKDKDTADLLLKGLPTLIGLDLSRKVGAGEMLSPLPFWDYDPSKGKRNATELVANAMGPWSSLLSRTWEAQKFLVQGDYAKALEQVLPYGVLSNGVKAMRLATQGFTNNSGDVTIKPEDISSWDLFGTSMGLTTSTLGDRTRLQGSVLNHDNAFNERKGRLQRDFNYAKRNHDYKAMAKAIKALGELNTEMRKVGYKPFKPDALQSGAKQQKAREKNVRAGVATTDRNRRYTEKNSAW